MTFIVLVEEGSAPRGQAGIQRTKQGRQGESSARGGSSWTSWAGLGTAWETFSLISSLSSPLPWDTLPGTSGKKIRS